MSKLDPSQYKRHALVKASSGETVGLAFIRNEEDVGRLGNLRVVDEDENIALTSSGYVSQETEDLIFKQEPKQGEGEEEPDMSNIFVGDSSEALNEDESKSGMKAAQPQDGQLLKADGSSSADLFDILAAELLRKSGGEPESTLVRDLEKVERENPTKLVVDPSLKNRCEVKGLKPGKKALDKPGKFGWLREVVTHPSKGHVTCVNYLTPPHSVTSARKRLKTQKGIESFLKTQDSHELSFQNFNLNSRYLGLAPEFETIRTSISPVIGSGNISMYAQFYRELPGDSTGGPQDYALMKVVEILFTLAYSILFNNKGR